jgi:class 3 adenylate cyclase
MPICTACGRDFEGDFAFCPYCGTALAAAKPVRELRKTVTVLFCDVAGSTSLGESVDPEALRAILVRYFERIRAIVEGHGGTVEKFVGDAVMAVFGVPVLHEDDALRAVRVAAEILEALPEVGVEARIGINTGEVVTGTEERLATGDAVNVASRLEKAALPGTALLGPETARLLQGAVELEPVPPLKLKGKSEPVEAYRLLAGSTRRWSGVSGSYEGFVTRLRGPRTTIPATCSRSWARRALASRGSPRSSSPASKLASSAAAAWPMEKGSHTGR